MAVASRCLFLLSLFLITTADFIGDGMSSESSNEMFFSSLDVNLDGTVEEFEVQQVVKSFGGGSLDEPEEIKRSVKNVFAQLDTNHDGTLTVAESQSYWRHLGGLLSVNEVVSWVIHGIQMPEAIGEIFRDNAVSGYDFAELIEDNGAGLDELGITKLAHKKKLVRSIKMLLSGVGVTPSAPGNPQVEGLSCHSAKLSWSTSDGFGFPIHKYRVFRHSMSMKNNISSKQLINHQNHEKNHIEIIERGDWILVYDGPSNEFIDTGLISGFQYEYQCEAWSLFGHSEIITFIGSALLTMISTDISCPSEYQQLYHSEEKEENNNGRSEEDVEDDDIADFEVSFSQYDSLWSPPNHEWSRSSSSFIWNPRQVPNVYSLPLLPPNMSGIKVLTNHSNHFHSTSSSFLYLISFIYYQLCTLWYYFSFFCLYPFMIMFTSLSPMFSLLTSLMRIRRSSLNHKHTLKSSLYDSIENNNIEIDEIYSWKLLSFLSNWLPFSSYLIPFSLRTDPKLYDLSIKNDGTASPAAIGIANMIANNVKPPEMINNSNHIIKNLKIHKQTRNIKNYENDTKCSICHQNFYQLKFSKKSFFFQRKFRTKHTCSVCWSQFCGSCGFQNHSWLSTCPVEGGCLCHDCILIYKKEEEKKFIEENKDLIHLNSKIQKENFRTQDDAILFPTAPILRKPPLVFGRSSSMFELSSSSSSSRHTNRAVSSENILRTSQQKRSTIPPLNTNESVDSSAITTKQNNEILPSSRFPKFLKKSFSKKFDSFS